MKFRQIALGLIAAALAASPLWAAKILSEGRYVAKLTPKVDAAGAAAIQGEVAGIDGLTNVAVDPEDSTLHFTVVSNRQVDSSDIEKAVSVTADGVSIGEPTEDTAPSSGTSGPPSTPGGGL